ASHGHTKALTMPAATNPMSTINIANMSVMFWINMRAGNPAAQYRFFEIQTNILTTGTKLYMDFGTDGALKPATALTTTAGSLSVAGGLTAGEWHHIVVTKSSTTVVKLYKDGVLLGTSSNGVGNNRTENNGTYSVAIMNDRDAGSSGIACYLDEFAIFEKEVSITEISSVYSTQIKKFMGIANV
ncbi:MAG: LamG domain-containing protein, partial [Candidatus Roizmanbacteria bacterium]|nr:LamG domain-containing protein [Candidatus Roizmanbacteria bacterium]